MFFTAAPLVEDVEVAVESRDCVAFASDELSAARLVLIELRMLEIVEECPASDELSTDWAETELELMDGWALVDDTTLAVDSLHKSQHMQMESMLT